MTVSMTVEYVGGLHCNVEHGPSRAQLSTDAPKDNQGRGEAFSPTDLVGAALISCAATIMAIKAPKEGIPFTTCTGRVMKEMTSKAPRRISKLTVVFEIPANVPADQRARLEEFARTCPVALSLSDDIDLTMAFEYRG